MIFLKNEKEYIKAINKIFPSDNIKIHRKRYHYGECIEVLSCCLGTFIGDELLRLQNFCNDNNLWYFVSVYGKRLALVIREM